MKVWVIKGRVLHTIKTGNHAFTEIEEKSGLGSPTVSKYLRELEREGLIIVELDRFTRKPRYKLNESRIDEINKLINVYLESEAKEFKEKIEIARNIIPEKEKIKLASYFITVDEEKRKQIEKMLEELLKEERSEMKETVFS